MEFRKYGDSYYVRMDRGDEIIQCLLDLCRSESIPFATFYGIGGLQSAEIQTFLPEKGEFETERIEGMLELISLSGNVLKDEQGSYCHHTHAFLSFKQDGAHRLSGGHIKSLTVRYTAEIELRPLKDGQITRRFDPETGTGFWHF